MAAKKKSKRAQPVPASDLVKLAEDHLQRGQAQEAVEILRSAEAKLKQSTTTPGKKVTIPPHLAAAKAALPGLFARALLARSLAARDPKQRLADLEEAAKRAPGEPLYLLARGATLISLGEAEAAYIEFQKADELRPGDPTILRAYALGLLATGRARQAKELLAQTPEEKRDAGWHRLAILCGMIGGLDAQVPGSGGRRFPLLDGLSRLARGEDEAARLQLSELPALDRNPSDGEAAQLATQSFYSAALDFAAGRYRAAVDGFAESARLAQSHRALLPWLDRIAPFLHKMAEAAVAEDPPLAIRCWQEAINLSPDDAAAQTNLSLAKRAQAQQAWRDGDVQSAIALWQESLKSKPQDERLLKNLAIASEKLDRKDEALTHWRALARLWRQQARSRAEEAGFTERLVRLEQHIAKLMIETDQNPNEVVNELEVAVKFDPDNLELRRQVAERLLEVDRPHQALKHLDVVERLQGASSDLLARKAVVFASQRRRADARKSFERAIELDASNAMARRGYLVLLGEEAASADKREDFDRAIEICQQQIALEPDYYPALSHLASLFFNVDRDAEARELLDRIIKSDPNSWIRRFRVAKKYLEHGFNKEAETEFDRAARLEPGFDCLHDIGVTYLGKNEVKKAIKYLDRAAEVANLDQLLDLADHALDADRPKDADRYLAKAKKLDPTSPMPYLARAINMASNPLSLIFGSSKPDEALKDLNEAERLIEGREGYAKEIEMIRSLKRILEGRDRPNLSSLFGSLIDYLDLPDPGFIPKRSGKKKRR